MGQSKLSRLRERRKTIVTALNAIDQKIAEEEDWLRKKAVDFHFELGKNPDEYHEIAYKILSKLENLDKEEAVSIEWRSYTSASTYLRQVGNTQRFSHLRFSVKQIEVVKQLGQVVQRNYIIKKIPHPLLKNGEGVLKEMK